MSKRVKAVKPAITYARRFRYTVTLPMLGVTGSLLASSAAHADAIVRRAYPRHALVTVTPVTNFLA